MIERVKVHICIGVKRHLWQGKNDINRYGRVSYVCLRGRVVMGIPYDESCVVEPQS